MKALFTQIRLKCEYSHACSILLITTLFFYLFTIIVTFFQAFRERVAREPVFELDV